jgi:hypothetical protein
LNQFNKSVHFLDTSICGIFVKCIYVEFTSQKFKLNVSLIKVQYFVV